MALSDTATLLINGGNFYTAAAGTAAPSSLASVPSAPWVNVGHTSIDDVLAFNTDGGEATSIGTLQKRVLRTSYSTRVETLNFTLQQWDSASLKLYFGSNLSQVSTTIWWSVPDSPAITTNAFLAIFVDGSTSFGIYAPSAELYRGDDLEFAVDELSGLPISVKPINYLTNTFRYQVTPLT